MNAYFLIIYFPSLLIISVLVAYVMAKGHAPWTKWKRKYESRGIEIADLQARLRRKNAYCDSLSEENAKLRRENAMLRDEYCIHGLP